MINSSVIRRPPTIKRRVTPQPVTEPCLSSGAHSPDPLARTRELTRPSRYLVCSCRVADIKQLFDHPISAGKQRRRNVYSEYLGCLELMISSSPAGCSMKRIGGSAMRHFGLAGVND